MLDNEYLDLGQKIMQEGERRMGRNGETVALFGTTLTHDFGHGFPLLHCRKIYYKGIIGEFISFLQDAKTVQEFEANGCNYWKLWAGDNGELILDYAPRKQLDYVIDLINNEPTSRRILIDLWNPENRGKLSLDPCHTQYQFFVRAETYLDMIWTQRSVDYAIGAPSDFVLAGLYVASIAHECRLLPGKITFNFGDTHVYKEHWEGFSQLVSKRYTDPPFCQYVLLDGIKSFNKDSITISNYKPDAAFKFVLKE